MISPGGVRNAGLSEGAEFKNHKNFCMAGDYWLIAVLIFSVFAIIWGTAKLKIHPFLVLLAASYFVAIAAGLPAGKIASVISSGFGNLMTHIGLVIVLGILLGTVLEKSGGAVKLAEMVIRLAGPRHPGLAMSFIGYFVSIPVFCDSGYVILSSIRKSLAAKTGKSSLALSVALATGLYATHTLVPPTPGPVAAAGNLGIDKELGMVIAIGLFVALVAMLTGYLWASYTGKKLKQKEKGSEEAVTFDLQVPLPAGWKTILPVAVPILLMAFRSFALFPSKPFGLGTLFLALDFAGQPVNALAFGFLFSLLLFPKFNMETLSGWIGGGIASSAPVILITGAGGAFGAVLSETGIGDILGNMLAKYQMGIFLPFFIAAIFKTAQGSSTVAMVATSALLAPMMSSLGLDSSMGATLSVMAIGAGSMVVSHANDSYFWVVTQFSDMDVADGYRMLTPATLVMGVVSIFLVWGLSLFLL